MIMIEQHVEVGVININYKMLLNYCQEISAKNMIMNHNLERRSRFFFNLVVRDKIEICFFYISCFKTNLVFQHLEFDLSHLEKGTRNKKLIFEVEQEFSREF